MEDLATVGGRVRHARLRNALTQDELAEKTGIPKATISRVETGMNASPRISTVRKLALALGVDAGWLLVGDVGDDDEGKEIAA